VGKSSAAIRRAIRVGNGWYGVFTTTDELRTSLDQIKEQLALTTRPRDQLFTLKVCMPSALTVPRDEVLKAVEAAKVLGLHEIVLHLPIRSKTMEADMVGWASDLGIEAPTTDVQSRRPQ
jgi:hypothetical protein